LAAGAATPGAAAGKTVELAKSGPPAPTGEQVRRISQLRRAARGSDRAGATEALRELRKMGGVAKRDLLNVTDSLLTGHKRAIEKIARRIGYPDKVKAGEARLAELREKAWENIRKLSKGDETVPKAREYYDKLMALHKEIAEVYAVRLRVIDAMTMRPLLLEIWRDLAGAGAKKRFTEAAEAALRGLAEKCLGMPVDEALAIPAFDGGGGPPEGAAGYLWHCRACRRIEQYNKTLREQMSAGEFENLQYVNAYREALGALRYEVDPRLLQSARRHSKEMADLGYFSHVSPTDSNQTFSDRLKNAGYRGASGENIFSGSHSGAAAFWSWFNSPGHHKNMVNRGSTAVGIGQWGTKWTQNMGRGKRLVLMDPADRKNAVIKGDILAPQQ